MSRALLVPTSPVIGPAQRLARGLAALGIAVGAAFLAVDPAVAAEAPVATLTDVTVDAAGASGLLSVRAGTVPLAIDSSGLAAELGGAPVDVEISAVEKARRTAVLVIDTSGSMGDTGMAVVRSAVATYLGAVPDDVAVGVVSFADGVQVRLRPTVDHAAVQQVVAGLKSGGETALFGGVRSAVGLLQGKGDRSIVLLGDGVNTVPKASAAAAAERRAALDAVRAAQLRLDVVAFTNDAAARATLQELATAGRGSMVPAADKAQVSAAFTNSATSLATQVRWEVQRPAEAAGRSELRLTGTAGGTAFETSTSLLLGPANAKPEVAQASSASTPITTSTWLLPVAAILIGVALVVFVIVAAAPALRSARHDRLSEIDAYGTGAERRRTVRPSSQTAAISDQLVGLGEKVMAGRESTSRTVELLDRADLPWRPGEWFVLRVVSVVAFLALALVLLGGILGFLAGLVLGVFLPAVWLRWKAKRRQNRFDDVLPDVMTIIASGLSSGFSFPQALDGVARDGAEPAAKEFSRALAETRIGADINVALDRVAQRMGSDSMKWVTMSIGIQREVGGNLAETLRTTAATLRERQMLKRQVRTLSAEGRLSAYILLALPIGIFLYSCKTNYEYVSLLWTRGLGLMMSGVGIVALLIGLVWMRNVVKIEV
ncbi:MAG: type II secretion system F family protein [Dermatophilaceae bacterium]